MEPTQLLDRFDLGGETKKKEVIDKFTWEKCKYASSFLCGMGLEVIFKLYHSVFLNVLYYNHIVVLTMMYKSPPGYIVPLRQALGHLQPASPFCPETPESQRQGRA